MKIEINKQMVAQGSYGISKINPRNGRWRGEVIDVWHVLADGVAVGTFPTREKARDAARETRRRQRIARA